MNFDPGGRRAEKLISTEVFLFIHIFYGLDLIQPRFLEFGWPQDMHIPQAGQKKSGGPFGVLADQG